MKELEYKIMILKAIRESIASIELESDFDNLEITDDLINKIEYKVMKLGGKNV